MSGYNDNLLSIALDGYFYLCDNEMPPELASNIVGMGERAPFETACVLKADIDLALDMLSPGRWSAICHDITLDILMDNIALLHKLSWRQQAIVRYHLLGQDIERLGAAKARRLMLRFLNGNITAGIKF